MPELHIHQLLKLTHKSVHHQYLLSKTFASYFTINNAVHSHNTRMNENLILRQSVKIWEKEEFSTKQVTFGTQQAHKRLVNVYITFTIAFRIGSQCPFIERLVLVKTFS